MVDQKKRLKQLSLGQKRSSVVGLDALHPDSLASNLPDQEEAYKQAEHLSEICDDTKRRGAGEIKSGLPGLKLLGEKASTEFHEKFTETDKVKKAEKKLVDVHGENRYDGPRFKVVAFPETLCVMCLDKNIVPRTGMLNLHPILEPMHNLVPGDVVRCALCAPCTAGLKKDASNQLRVVLADGQEVPASVVKAAENYKKMTGNIEYLLRLSTLTEMGRVFSEEGQVNGQ